MNRWEKIPLDYLGDPLVIINHHQWRLLNSEFRGHLYVTYEVTTETGEVEHLGLGVMCMREMIKKKIIYISKTTLKWNFQQGKQAKMIF